MQSNNAVDGEKIRKNRFYPNAVHCLLELYYRAYDKHLNGQQQLDDEIWSEIAMEMKESFFFFNSDEVKNKFKQLRDHYFNLRTVSDLRSFEYFEALHNIYKDLQKQILLQEAAAIGGEITLEDDDNDEEAEILSTIKPTYADEILFQESLQPNVNEINNVTAVIKQPYNIWIKTENQDKQCENTAQDVDYVPEEKISKSDNNYCDDNNKIPPEVDIAIRDLNIQQERRHREQMKMWRQILRQQECMNEQQRLLLEMFSKRV